MNNGDKILNFIIAGIGALLSGCLLFWPVLYGTLLLSAGASGNAAGHAMPVGEVLISLLVTLAISITLLMVVYRWLNRRAKTGLIK